MEKKIVDARGLACPLPVVNAKEISSEEFEMEDCEECNEDADTLEDLKTLESEGVKILTCGTCLDFYGIKDKLAVGAVTNMYEIVETMENAKSIVRP